ncbi:monocarboxylate transporter 9-like [Glandiceps talaboti]
MPTTPTAPDGGWGWFVVAGTFIVYALTSGSALAFGVLYVPLLDAFGESRAKTAFIGSISYLVTVLTNPYSSLLCDKVGHRPVVMFGGAIAAISVFLSSFTTNLFQMYITYGLFVGIGNGFTHAPSVLIVSKYFDKRLPTATGVALAGSGFGMVVFSVITQKLLDIYGWRGTLMVISALTVHLSLAGSLYRPLRGTLTPRTEQSIEMLAINKETINIAGDVTKHDKSEKTSNLQEKETPSP